MSSLRSFVNSFFVVLDTFRNIKPDKKEFRRIIFSVEESSPPAGTSSCPAPSSYRAACTSPEQGQYQTSQDDLTVLLVLYVVFVTSCNCEYIF